MTIQEIRTKINKNNFKIRQSLENNCFVLSDEINNLLKENEEIREKCPHEFVDGVCKWCDEIEVKD